MRITVHEALQHPWFKTEVIHENKEDDKLDEAVINSLRDFKGISKLKKAALNVLVRSLEPNQIEHLRQQFYKLDKDMSGLVNA